MNTNPSIYSIIIKRKHILLASFVLVCGLLTTVLDYWEAEFQGSSFYISESLLFSVFWLLFLPFLNLQYVLITSKKKETHPILAVLIPILLHLFVFPAVVWVVSKLLYNHTFSYDQTLQFSITEHLFTLLLVYSIPLIIYFLTNTKKKTTEQDVVCNELLTSIIVMDGNKRISIETLDILFFSTNSPYITIHHPTKKYLQNTTLKSISNQLDKSVFVQIHKSTIVNLKHVHFYSSRLNGDYDLTLNDGTKLRVSRTYAAEFKSLFRKSHQDITK